MLKVLDIEKKQEWDEIVKSFKDYDIYYLNGYNKCLEINGDGSPLLFYYEDSSIKAVNVVIKRDVSKDPKFKGLIEENKYFDFSSPYGYGGWIVEGNGSTDNLFKEYENWCKENKIISEFVRFHPLIDNQKYSESFYNVIPLGKVIALDTRDKDIMWANMSSRNRNKVKKARNNSIIITNNGVEKLDIFKTIYEETMTRDNAEDYYFFDDKYYDCLFNDLKDNVTIFNAEYNNEVISSCIIMFANNRVSYHLSGSRRMTNNIYETNLLLYSVGEWANEQGFDTFLLGGGVGSHEDNLYRFKEGFDDKHNYQFYIGKKTYNEELYNELVSKRSNIENPNYFPMYRG